LWLHYTSPTKSTKIFLELCTFKSIVSYTTRAAIQKGAKDLEIVKVCTFISLTIQNDPWLERDESKTELKTFLQSPTRRYKPKFNLVTGIRGCGKSALASESTKEMGERVIYISFIKGDEGTNDLQFSQL
jgi:hypothetical protein